MTLRQLLSIILFEEDNGSSYGYSLNKEVLQKNKNNQTKLSQISYIDFNKERIERSLKLRNRDMQFNYNTCQDFIKDVFNYFKTNNIKINQDDINIIKRASTDYYNKFKLKQHSLS